MCISKVQSFLKINYQEKLCRYNSTYFPKKFFFKKTFRYNFLKTFKLNLFTYVISDFQKSIYLRLIQKVGFFVAFCAQNLFLICMYEQFLPFLLLRPFLSYPSLHPCNAAFPVNNSYHFMRIHYCRFYAPKCVIIAGKIKQATATTNDYHKIKMRFRAIQ